MSENDRDPEDPIVVPVVEERLQVDKQAVRKGTVRVDKRVRTEPVRVSEDLREEVIEVERVPIDRFVDHPPSPYQDGDTWVMPVVEEVLVVERRLKLREEVRITRRVTTRNEIQEVERRIEEVEVHRTT